MSEYESTRPRRLNISQAMREKMAEDRRRWEAQVAESKRRDPDVWPTCSECQHCGRCSCPADSPFCSLHLFEGRSAVNMKRP